MSKSTGFQPPPWVKEPKLPNCGIKVRKGGKIIEEISSLQEQSCVTLGRHKEMADIKLEHPSISRRHAMFGHGSSGNIYVMDLGSTHGTFVNNIRLVKHKREALKNNSIVKFGASTREYIVKLDLDTPDDEEHISTSDTKPSNSNNNNNNNNTNNNTATNGHTNNVNDTSNNNSTTNDYNDKNNNNNKNSSKKRPLSDKENDEPSNKKIHLEEVRCRHLLVKHKESRRPRSWRCDDITKTKEEARNEIEKLRNDIITQSEKPPNENENDDDDNNNDSNNNNKNKNKKEKFANPLEKAFASFARRLSDCNSARHSGDLGKFKKGKMQKPFENAAFSLNVGQLSEPVETDSGIHLIYRMS